MEKIKENLVSKYLQMAATLKGKDFTEALIAMKEVRLFVEALPEIDIMDQFEHTPTHHPEGNVWEHTLSALRYYDGNDPVVNLAILFHDIGKPETHHTEMKNGMLMHRYFRHERKGYKMLDEVAERLGFDEETTEAIKFATLNHMKFHLLLEMGDTKVYSLMQSPYWDVLYKVAEADDHSRLEAFDPDKWNAKVAKIERIRNNPPQPQVQKRTKKGIRGKLVMEVLELESGPKIGEVLKTTNEWIKKNNIDLNDVDKIREFILSQK